MRGSSWATWCSPCCCRSAATRTSKCRYRASCALTSSGELWQSPNRIPDQFVDVTGAAVTQPDRLRMNAPLPAGALHEALQGATGRFRIEQHEIDFGLQLRAAHAELRRDHG